MKRTYLVPGVGEINPEAAADTLFVCLWAGVATAVIKFAPSYVQQLLAVDWFYQFLVLAFSIVLAYAVVHVPLAYYGLIWTDSDEFTEFDY